MLIHVEGAHIRLPFELRERLAYKEEATGNVIDVGGTRS